MKKEFLLLLCFLSIAFWQCQKTPTVSNPKSPSMMMIDSLTQLIQAKTLNHEDSAAAQLHIALAYEYYKDYQFATALKAYQKANTIWQQADAKRYVANIKDNDLNIAGLFDKMGDYQLAINYYEQALTHFIAVKDTGLITEIYLNMGIAALHAKDSAKIFLLERGLALINTQKQPNPYLKAALLQCLGKATSDYRHDYTTASTHLKAALKYCELNKDTANIAETAIEIAKVYAHQSNYLMAINYAHKSLLLRQQLNNGKAVECYQVLGDIKDAQQQLDSSLFFYQKALQSLDTTFINDDVLMNPAILVKTFNRKIELLNVLSHKIVPLSILYEKTGNKRRLETAFQTCQLADKVVQALRRDMQDDQSKYFWNETALPIYKKAIDVAYKLYELTGEERYKLNILQFSERTKAPVLREGIADNQAKDFAGVPASERQRERELRATIAILEKEADNKPSLTGQLAKIRTQLHEFQESLKTKYPTYARYLAATYQISDSKFQISTDASGIWNLKSGIIKSIQNQLSDSTLLIEYAYGTTDLYQIAVSNTDFKVFKQPLAADINRQIDRFISSVSDYTALQKDYTAAERNYVETSFDLYHRLLEAPLKAMSFEPSAISPKLKTDSSKPIAFKRIYLILEDKLHLLPFKALTDSHLTGFTADYPKHFLVHKYAFSNRFSIQNLNDVGVGSNPTSDNSTPTSLGCFGLDFKDSLWQASTPTTDAPKKNSILINAKAEVEGVAKTYKGKVYFNEDATKETFKKVASQYSILHITTHGYPEGLVFQKTNAADSLHEVTIGDIYSLNLHSRFTFLSACETGQGKLTEAEGVMSLGRAFTYAGSQSVTMSLWSIPDGSSSKIAQQFYTYCGQGIPKDVAEQRAEIAFLKTAPDAQLHPNHWAAFTIIGDMSPLPAEKKTYSDWIKGLLAGLLIGLLASYFLVKRKKTT